MLPLLLPNLPIAAVAAGATATALLRACSFPRGLLLVTTVSLFCCRTLRHDLASGKTEIAQELSFEVPSGCLAAGRLTWSMRCCASRGGGMQGAGKEQWIEHTRVMLLLPASPCPPATAHQHDGRTRLRGGGRPEQSAGRAAPGRRRHCVQGALRRVGEQRAAHWAGRQPAGGLGRAQQLSLTVGLCDQFSQACEGWEAQA